MRLVFVAAFVFMAALIFTASKADDPASNNKIRVVSENGITCAKVLNWSGQSCWRDK